MTRYRLKDRAPKHFINGRIVGAGEVVELKPEIKPGMWLEPIEAPEPAATPAPASTGSRGRKAAVVTAPDPAADESEGVF